MQQACDSLCSMHHIPRIPLSPNILYIRFLPKDSTEYNALRALDVELFDFPLHYELIDDANYYRDPTVPDSLITWQYAAVPYVTQLPNMVYEVLDTCYVPPNVQRQETIPDFNYNLENLASRIANPELFDSDQRYSVNSSPRSSAHPNGYVKVLMNGQQRPVKGVKVRTWYFVNISHTYSNNEGYYYINSSYSFDPRYSISFENSIGFEEFGSYLSATPSWSCWKRHSKNGHDFLFHTNEDSWIHAAVNNRIVEYFELCSAEGRTPPPSNLRVLNLTSQGQGSGAPMLKQIGYSELLDYNNDQLYYGLMHFVGGVSVDFYRFIKYALPDIVILSQSTEEYLHRNVYHELNHASHFSNAGLSVWGGVINHTIRTSWPQDLGYGNGTYYDSSEKASELAESWAFANERILQIDSLYCLPYNTSSLAGHSLWFAPSINAIYHLIENNLLEPSQVLANLAPSVLSIDDLLSQLIYSFPSKRIWISNTFAKEHALSKQTVWKIINLTSSTTLVYITRKGSVIKNQLIPPGGYGIFTSIPDTNKGFSAVTQYPYTDYYPDEFTIRKYHNAAIVYRQLFNGVIVPMNRPFFTSNEWSHTYGSITAGNKVYEEYTYTITDSDIN